MSSEFEILTQLIIAALINILVNFLIILPISEPFPGELFICTKRLVIYIQLSELLHLGR